MTAKMFWELYSDNQDDLDKWIKTIRKNKEIQEYDIYKPFFSCPWDWDKDVLLIGDSIEEMAENFLTEYENEFYQLVEQRIRNHFSQN